MKLVVSLAVAVLSVLCCKAQVPASNHVVIVLEENHSYSSVIGNSSMPYLNSLANKYTLATNYYANTHPSIGNYFMLTTGAIITNSDGFSGTVSQDNIVRHILSAGKTWKSYAESLPSIGYTGGDKYPYIKHHNPEAYFTDVINSTVQKLNLVPFTQFSTDLMNGNLPSYTFVIPNQLHNAHDGTLAAADSWLKTNIAPLVASPAFQTGGDGILVIVFDESNSSDTAHGGGHIACIIVSPKSKPSYRSTTFYQHQSLLRTLMEALGMTSFPAGAGTAADMAEIFGTVVTPQVTIQTPTAGSTVPSTFNVAATFTNGGTANYMKVWVDGVQKFYQSNTSSIATTLTLATGSRRITVQAYNGVLYKAVETVTVQ